MKDNNVVELRPNSAVQLLEKLIEMAKNGEVDKFIFVGTNKEGTIISGNYNTTVLDENSLISYSQLKTFEKFMNCKKETITEI